MRSIQPWAFALTLALCWAPPTAVAQEPDPSPSASAAPAVELDDGAAAEDQQPSGGLAAIEKAGAFDVFNQALEQVNGTLETALFFDVAFGALGNRVDESGQEILDDEGKPKPVILPFIVCFLALGCVFFTLFFGFINVRGFKHSIDVIAGRYDDPDDPGEISHFQALTSALSATVGLGNIAGVAIAIQTGGPGAVFWMILLAAFGMTVKFNSCTLAQLFRQTNEDGSVSGGPMYYLDIGLREKGLGSFGRVLGVTYALMVMGGAFGGGNMFQSNQSYASLAESFGITWGYASGVYGFVMAVMVALVILGGIQRIGSATAKIVPSMCLLYVVAALAILAINIDKVPGSLGLIFQQAFTGNAVFGGAIGVAMTGFQRAAFSNEAGLGSAAIAHAAAKTDEPVREGMVAMIGPFIDTMVICTMTALVVIVTGTYAEPGVSGSALTTNAFATLASWFPYVLSLCIVMFAFSTMISWCYYGERGWIYLVDVVAGEGAGIKSVTIFRLAFVFFVFVGAVSELGPVIGFSDLMILCMAFPNILGSVILAPVVYEKLQDYWGRFTSGEMKTYAEHLAEKSGGAAAEA